MSTTSPLKSFPNKDTLAAFLKSNVGINAANAGGPSIVTSSSSSSRPGTAGPGHSGRKRSNTDQQNLNPNYNNVNIMSGPPGSQPGTHLINFRSRIVASQVAQLEARSQERVAVVSAAASAGVEVKINHNGPGKTPRSGMNIVGKTKSSNTNSNNKFNCHWNLNRPSTSMGITGNRMKQQQTQLQPKTQSQSSSSEISDTNRTSFQYQNHDDIHFINVDQQGTVSDSQSVTDAEHHLNNARLNLRVQAEQIRTNALGEELKLKYDIASESLKELYEAKIKSLIEKHQKQIIEKDCQIESLKQEKCNLESETIPGLRQDVDNLRQKISENEKQYRDQYNSDMQNRRDSDQSWQSIVKEREQEISKLKKDLIEKDRIRTEEYQKDKEVMKRCLEKEWQQKMEDQKRFLVEKFNREIFEAERKTQVFAREKGLLEEEKSRFRSLLGKLQQSGEALGRGGMEEQQALGRGGMEEQQQQFRPDSFNFQSQALQHGGPGQVPVAEKTYQASGLQSGMNPIQIVKQPIFHGAKTPPPGPQQGAQILELMNQMMQLNLNNSLLSQNAAVNVSDYNLNSNSQYQPSLPNTIIQPQLNPQQQFQTETNEIDSDDPQFFSKRLEARVESHFKGQNNIQEVYKRTFEDSKAKMVGSNENIDNSQQPQYVDASEAGAAYSEDEKGDDHEKEIQIDVAAETEVLNEEPSDNITSVNLNSEVKVNLEGQDQVQQESDSNVQVTLTEVTDVKFSETNLKDDMVPEIRNEDTDCKKVVESTVCDDNIVEPAVDVGPATLNENISNSTDLVTLQDNSKSESQQQYQQQQRPISFSDYPVLPQNDNPQAQLPSERSPEKRERMKSVERLQSNSKTTQSNSQCKTMNQNLMGNPKKNSISLNQQQSNVNEGPSELNSNVNNNRPKEKTVTNTTVNVSNSRVNPKAKSSTYGIKPKAKATVTQNLKQSKAKMPDSDTNRQSNTNSKQETEAIAKGSQGTKVDDTNNHVSGLK